MTVIRWPRYKLLLYEPNAGARRLFSRSRRLMIEMMPKWLSALTLLGAAAVLQADSAVLQQVQTVYLLPMGYGLDQYLANRLTAEGVFHVVTDPKRADAVLTDNIGAGFERKFEELYAPPAPPPPPASNDDDPNKSKEMDAEFLAGLKRSGGQPPVSSFSRGKGNVFLVDVKTRTVLWSLFEQTKKILPEELDRTSGRIVQRLKKDRSGKP
jgi:hypothetical protein